MNPTPPPKITAEWLRAQHACSKQVETFAREWPAGAGITKANLLRAAALNLNTSWLASHVLSEPAHKAYDAAVATALDAYRAAMGAAVKAFDAGVAPTYEACRAAIDPAHKAFHEVVAHALWHAGSTHGWKNVS